MVVTIHNSRDILANWQTSPIDLRPVYPEQKRKFFTLTQDLSVILSSGETVTIPAGFTTDLSSVPRFLWGIASPFGNFLLAALIHDYLYINRIGTRKAADKEMFVWSVVLNENMLDNITRYLAVRIFGKSWWNS